MASQVIIKKSSIPAKVPLDTDLAYGELAINYADKKLYFKTSTNQIMYLTPTTELSGTYIATPQYIDFDLTYLGGSVRGRLSYNSEDDTLNIGHDNGVVQQIGQEFFTPPCINNSGITIENGKVVMATGSQGDKITVAKAVSNGTVDPEYMLGVATATYVNGATNVAVVTTGIVRDIDTSAWTVGTVLYMDPTIAGGLTNTKPSAPAIRAPIGFVLRQHATTGRVYIRMTNGSTLGSTDSNVKIETLTDRDFLVYETVSGLWKNKKLSDVITAQDLGTGTPTADTVLNGNLEWIEIPGGTGGNVFASGIVLGTSWTVFQSASGELVFKNGTTDVAKIDASGNLTVIGSVIAHGTI